MGTTQSPIFGTTLNPWDTDRTSGGSSGGEAAAIALGFSPLGIGSDTAGSIRLPASYCGIYGFKPSCQKISRQGLIPSLPGQPNLDNHLTVVGPMARSIRDLLLCYQILSGEEKTRIEFKKEPKIAWTGDYPDIPLDDEVKSAIVYAVNRLKKNGFNVEKTSPAINMNKVAGLGFELLSFEFYLWENSTLLRRIFWKTLLKGGTFQYYKKLLVYRAYLIDELDRFLSQWDYWIIPVSSTTAFHHNRNREPILINEEGKQKKIKYFTAASSLTIPFNYTGHPSITIPVGKDSKGLPVSIQLIGRRGQDLELLNIASVIDKKLGNIFV